jgi:magnesium-transporting ATPase (P-type)
VETLGSTSIICSDKTGTLTKNEMTVTTLFCPMARCVRSHRCGLFAGWQAQSRMARELTATDDAALKALLEAVVLCNDAQLVPPDAEDTRWRALGDPTEAALLTVALKGCVEPEKLRHHSPRRAEIPFDSATKMMATQHGHGASGRIVFKGAPEMLLDLCDPSTARSGPNASNRHRSRRAGFARARRGRGE